MKKMRLMQYMVILTQIGQNIDRKSTISFCTFCRRQFSHMKKQKIKYHGTIKRGSRIPSDGPTTSKLTWIKQVLANLNINVNELMKMLCDNQMVLHIASNPVFHERTKHIEVDWHFIREKVQSKEIKTPFSKVKIN
jgi:hypothetical protein